MLILLCHELGHYFVARLHGVDASLPYFIPLPPGFGLGTLGAVIGMRNATTDRKKLIDVGAAGPLAGLVVAIPVLVVRPRRTRRSRPLVAGGHAGGELDPLRAAQARWSRAPGCPTASATSSCTRRRRPAGPAC